MKCFLHRDNEAIGTCKSCGKGVCALCAVDLGKGLACKGNCEDDVHRLIVMIQRSLTAHKKADAQKRLGAWIIIVMGLILAGFGVYRGGELFTLIAGGLIVILGIGYHVLPDYAKTARGKPASDRDGLSPES